MADTPAPRGAQRVLNYLAAVGPAALISVDGEVRLCTPAFPENLLEAAKLIADVTDPWAGPECFDTAGACIYFTPIGNDHVLFVVAQNRVSPGAVVERLTRAAAVFLRVLRRDAGALPGTPTGGSPAAALHQLPGSRKHVRRWA